MTYRQIARRLLTPLVVVAAMLYFVVDAVFLSLVRPLAARLARLPVFLRIVNGLRTLGPYPTLALFIVPIIIFEPIKPVAAYLAATGHVTLGLLLVIVGEIVKVTVLERLFHVSRDKLMSIPAFARTYNFVQRWLNYLRALPPWQAVTRRARRVKSMAHHLWKIVRGNG
jgi:hypothetical protein